MPDLISLKFMPPALRSSYISRHIRWANCMEFTSLWLPWSRISPSASDYCTHNSMDINIHKDLLDQLFVPATTRRYQITHNIHMWIVWHIVIGLPVKWSGIKRSYHIYIHRTPTTRPQLTPLIIYSAYTQKASFVERPRVVGKPKYFFACASFSICNIDLTFFLNHGLTVGAEEYNLSVLVHQLPWAPAENIRPSTSCNWSAALRDASKNTMQSSIKKRCKIQGLWIPPRTRSERCKGSTDLMRQEIEAPPNTSKRDGGNWISLSNTRCRFENAWKLPIHSH